MNDYIKFKKELLESCTRSNLRLLKIGYSVFLLNILGSAWNIFNLYMKYSHCEWLTGISIGATFVSAMWVWMSICDLKCNIKSDKEIISHLDTKDDKEFLHFYSEKKTLNL